MRKRNRRGWDICLSPVILICLAIWANGGESESEALERLAWAFLAFGVVNFYNVYRAGAHAEFMAGIEDLHPLVRAISTELAMRMIYLSFAILMLLAGAFVVAMNWLVALLGGPSAAGLSNQ